MKRLVVGLVSLCAAIALALAGMLVASVVAGLVSR
jgi:hypothetical protein